MNHKQFLVRGITFILVVLVVAGCTATKADVSATVAPQTCPTAEIKSCPTAIAQACPTAESHSCPTAAAQVMPERSGFRKLASATANAIITFEPGDKCSMRVLKTVVIDADLRIELEINDNAYQDYIVWIYYLDPGMTLDDLKTQDTDPITPAPFIHIAGAMLATPMSRTLYVGKVTINPAQGPFYFTCQVDGPGPRKMIDHLGPLEIRQ